LCGHDSAEKPLAIEETTNINAMKFSKKLTPQVRSRLRSVLMVAAMLLLNTLSAWAQAEGLRARCEGKHANFQPTV